MSLLETTTSASGSEALTLLACATSDGDLLAWELSLSSPAADAVMEVLTSCPPVVTVEGGGAQR